MNVRKTMKTYNVLLIGDEKARKKFSQACGAMMLFPDTKYAMNYISPEKPRYGNVKLDNIDFRMFGQDYINAYISMLSIFDAFIYLKDLPEYEIGEFEDLRLKYAKINSLAIDLPASGYTALKCLKNIKKIQETVDEIVDSEFDKISIIVAAHACDPDSDLYEKPKDVINEICNKYYDITSNRNIFFYDISKSKFKLYEKILDYEINNLISRFEVSENKGNKYIDFPSNENLIFNNSCTLFKKSIDDAVSQIKSYQDDSLIELPPDNEKNQRDYYKRFGITPGK